MKVIKLSEVKPEEVTGGLFEGRVIKQILIDPGLSWEFRVSLITFNSGAGKNIRSAEER